jgi:hypothetical protein
MPVTAIVNGSAGGRGRQLAIAVERQRAVGQGGGAAGRQVRGRDGHGVRPAPGAVSV